MGLLGHGQDMGESQVRLARAVKVPERLRPLSWAMLLVQAPVISSSSVLGIPCGC